MRNLFLQAIGFFSFFIYASIVFGAPNKSGIWVASGNVLTACNDALLLKSGASVMLKPDANGGAFKDFELSLKVRTLKNANGFIAFHTDSDFKKGYKIAIDNSRDSKIWWRKTGSLLGVRNIVKRMSDDGQWAEVRAKVYGNCVDIFVNGKQLVEYAQPDKPYRTQLNKTAVLGEGAIGLKCTSGEGIEIKDFSVKKLKATNKRMAAEPESADSATGLHQADFPVLDYHVHLKGDLDAEKAKKQSRKCGINYAIAANCGKDFPINNDQLALEFLTKNLNEPYLVAMQAEGREWMKLISAQTRKKFAFVFTDAMTFEDRKGNRVHLWKPNEVKIDDPQNYMDLIVEKICEVVGEPADIYVNATYLPDALIADYAKLWTKKRRQKVLDALVKGRMALEISAKYKLPDADFIKAAKARGVKFTFGSNNGNSDFGKLEYCIEMIKQCGLRADDMLKP